LVAVLVICLFCGALVRLEIASVIVALFVGCMCSLIGSLVFFIRDVNLSLKALWLDFPPQSRGKLKGGRTGSAYSANSCPRPSIQLSG
jgi:hypothetical protein